MHYCELGQQFNAAIATQANELYLQIERLEQSTFKDIDRNADQMIYILARAMAELEQAILISRRYQPESINIELFARLYITAAR